MSAPKRCSGCYDSFSGPWCDNCDTWPCKCVEVDQPETTPCPFCRLPGRLMGSGERYLCDNRHYWRVGEGSGWLTSRDGGQFG